MKYPIDKELKSISIYSGSVVGWMYPMINIGYRLRKCRSDKCISVRRVSTPGYGGEKINTSHARYSSISEIDHLDFFPKTYVEVAEFDCLHDEGIAFAKTLISEGVETEYYSVHGTCHGFEAATGSSILNECMKRRIEWMQNVYKVKD